jgi:hypothetical protein
MKWYRFFKTIFSGGDHGTMKLEVAYPLAGGIDLKSTNVTTTGTLTAGTITAGTIEGTVSGSVLSTVSEKASGDIDTSANYTILTASVAAAYTLEDASASNSGKTITIVSTKAVANTVTCTGKYSGATVAADSTVATFGTTVAGNSITLVSNGTTWVCVANQGVVFS